MSGTWLNPTMTSATAPYGEVSASDYYDTVYPYRSFDHFTDVVGWTRTPGTTTAWLQYKFQSGVGVDAKAIIDEYRVTCSGYPNRAPKTWTLEASNTGDFTGEEVTLDTQTDETGWGEFETRTYEFSNSVGYYYYRWVITANNGDASYIQTAELALWGAFETTDEENYPGISIGSADMMVI